MRWAQLVQAARTLSQHHYRRLDWSAAHRALELAEQERYAEAGRVVEELDRDGQTDALGALAAELRLCTLLNQARQFESQEQYPEAESAAAQAAQALQQLPASYRALLLEELGDLPGWLERLHQQALAAREAEQTLGEMERSFERSFQEGYAHLEDTFRQQPSQVAAARRALHWAEQYLKQEAYAQADAVAGLGLDYVARPRERQRLLQVWQLARGMERLQEVWQRRAWPEAPQLADELRAAQPAAAVCLETFAAGHFDRAHLEGDYAAARTAYELLGTEARASRQAQSEQLARQHDQDLAQQRAQIGAALEAAGQAAELDPNAPGWAARLAEAVAQLDRALALAKETGVAQDEQDRLQTLRADIEARQAALEQARAAYRTNREQLVAHLWVLLSPGQPALHGAAATSLANPIGLPAIYQRRLWQTVRDAARDLLTVLPADAERLRWETWRDAADQALQQFELQEPDRAPAPEGVSHPQPAEPVPGAPDHPPAASRPAVQSRLSAGAAGDSRRLVALLGIGLAVLVLQLLVILILLMQG
jgi:hypothetical protein